MKKITLLLCIMLTILLVGCKKETTYEIRFVGFDGELITTIEVENTNNILYPKAPIVEGHDFIGWVKEEKEGCIEITAKYKKQTFRVNFYNKDSQLIDTQIIEYGLDADTSNLNMEIEGYQFMGWDKDYTNVNEELSVYPKYEQKKYVVKFYDAENNLILEKEVMHGESVTAPDAPTKDGFIFSSWDKEFTSVKSNLDIYPVFVNTICEVKFVDMYGDTISTQIVEKGTAATAPSAPNVKYYTFSNWDKDFSNVESDLVVKAVYAKNNEVHLNTNANYWLQVISSKYNITKTILTEEEITKFNEKVLSDYSKTKVIDVKTIEVTATKSYVNSLITRYSNINKYVVYNNETKKSLSATEKDAILSNRSLDKIPANVNVKFGLITDFAWVRSYPTNHYSNNYSMDRFQETTINVGEGVAIYHESLDGNWYFVQAQNYNGWVEKKYIAECSKEEMVNFLSAKDKLVVISDYVIIESVHVRMGQAFPLVSQEANYTIKFPTRNEDGRLLLKEVSLEKTDDYSVGYLEYTYENVMTQAFKLLGIDYSWGDKEKDGRDCSSTMNAIYLCFGFMMPRNTSNQVAIPTYGTSIAKGTFSVSKMKNYAPGTMIFTSSHVMLYIGEDESGNPYLLHNTTSGDGACILQSLSSYGTSKIIGTLKMQ